MFRCKHKDSYVNRYLHDALSSREYEKIRDHILSCEDCSKALEAQKFSFDVFKNLFSMDNSNLHFVSSKNEIMNYIDKEYFTGGFIDRFYLDLKRNFLKYSVNIAVFMLVLIVSATFLIRYNVLTQFAGIKNKTETSLSENALIKLNPMSEAGSDGEVSKVKITSAKDKFGSAAYVYEVVNAVTDADEISSIFSRLGLVEYEKDLKSNVFSIKDKKGNLLTVNKKSGTMEFFSERINQGKSDEIIENLLSDAEYRQRADEFIDRLGLAGDVEFEFVKQGQIAEFYDKNNVLVKKPIRVEVTYKKRPVDGLEFDGVGPGIKVEFDASGSVVSFLWIKRDIRKSDKKVLLKSESEIIDAIKNKKDTLIYGVYGGGNEIELTEFKLVLYSDPAQMKQDYMVPHFVFSGKNIKTGEEVSVIMNALKSKYYSYKVNSEGESIEGRVLVSNETRKISSEEVRGIIKGMKYGEIIRKLGVTKEIGSGLYIYQYIVDEGLYLNISFGNMEDICPLNGEELLKQAKHN